MQDIGFETADGHSKPAGHSVQFVDAPPSEYIPFGQGTGE